MGNSFLAQVLLIFTASYLCMSQPITLPDGEDINDLDETDRDINFEKRMNRFIRIGKALNSFVRIGRDNPHGELFSDVAGDSGAYDGFYPDANPDEYQDEQKRTSAFVRIGKSGIPAFEDEDAYDAPEKRAGAFIRMGKFPSSAFIERLDDRMNSFGHQPYYRRTGRIGHSSFIRIGKRDTSDALRRVEEEAGLDKAEDGQQAGVDVEEKDILPRYLRIGKDLGDLDGELEAQKRLSNFVRIGGGFYGPQSNSGIYNSKRPSSFVRIGRQPEELEKRYSSFVPIGKSNPFVTSDEGTSRMENTDDRGKRYSSFVRIGRNNLLENPEKRYSSFVRIGKSGMNEDPEKRASSFVRIGKNGQDALEDDLNNDSVKCSSSFVRIGRNSFVRIGRDVDDVIDSEEPAKPSKRASSFVRIGKSTDATKQTNIGSDQAIKM